VTDWSLYHSVIILFGTSFLKILSLLFIKKMPFDSTDYSFPNVLSKVAIGVSFSLSIIAILSIMFALAVFFMTPALRTAQSNYLLLSLLATCLVLSVSFVILDGILIMDGSWIFLSGMGCLSTGFLNQMCLILEVYTLMCMAVERYFAVVRERPLSKSEILLMVVFGWIGCAFLAR
jgi:hypothetical protein